MNALRILLLFPLRVLLRWGWHLLGRVRLLLVGRDGKDTPLYYTVTL